MILITAPRFGDLTSLNEQLPEVVRMAMGATVSRIRIELILRGCWNLITPCGQHRTAVETTREPTQSSVLSAFGPHVGTMLGDQSQLAIGTQGKALLPYRALLRALCDKHPTNYAKREQGRRKSPRMSHHCASSAASNSQKDAAFLP
jgi:hypothetical protein